MKIPGKWIIGAFIAIVILTAAAAAYYFKQNGSCGPDPAKMNSQQIHAFMQSDDFNRMPRQERHEFFDKVMDSRVQGYFNTSPEKRQEYLDNIIDDMQKNRPTNFNPQRRDPNRVRQMQQRFRNSSPEDRRFGREMRDPVKDSMRREFLRALRDRAESRGIPMGRGMGPGGGRP